MACKQDKITITETEDTVNILLEMKSIKPCVNSLKQYKTGYKAEDILKDSYFKGSVCDNILEIYNEELYGAIRDLDQGDDQ